MIKLENVVMPSAEQWKAIIMGTRNPLNSWDKSDSKIINATLKSREIMPGVESMDYVPCEPYLSIGYNDISLMKKLAAAGTDHRKFMRMIIVYVDIIAPLYWWKEFDTYKVGSVTNSCSTMHKIHEKEFTLGDFSCEHLVMNDESKFNSFSSLYSPEPFRASYSVTPGNTLEIIIDVLNVNREAYVKTGVKRYWWQIIQLLPSSYNQKRTVMLNYEVLANIYKSRKNHKLDEWVEFCKWIETLPYSELITREEKGE